MIFQAMKEGSRIVKIYREEAQYEINDETRKAFKFSDDKRIIQIPYTAALSQIASHREHDNRVYRYELKVSQRTFSKWFGWTLLGVTIFLAAYLLITGQLL